MPEMVRLLLVGEHALLLQGLSKLLEGDTSIEVRATVYIDEAEARIGLEPPQVVVAETSDVPAAADWLARLRRAAVDAPLLVVAPGDPDQLLAALRAGARGFVARDASAENLVRCVHALARGEWGLPRALSGELAEAYLALTTNHHHAVQLTDRERSVLDLLVQGWTAQRIGQKLYLSESAVRGVIRGIARKLGVANRTQIVTAAVRQGLVSRD